MATRARVLVGELFGTFLIVVLGTGAVAVAVLTDAALGLPVVALAWGMSVTLAIYCTAPLSGAHLNPAVTLAFCLCRGRGFPWASLPGYWAAQLSGAVLAGLAILALFGPVLAAFEERAGLVRGGPGSERAAMIFGEYFPNPALFGGARGAMEISPLGAAAVEALGTGILVFVILALTSPANRELVPQRLTPVLIGATVGLLILVFAPLTQAGWNPARDFGPRVVAWLAGYGPIALPGPQAGFWVYIMGPFVGASAAAGLATLLFQTPAGAHHPAPGHPRGHPNAAGTE